MASISKNQEVLAGARPDDTHLNAIRAWLSSPQSIEELRATIQASPVAFLAAHIHSLPAQLLEPFASLTTAQQRSSVPLVLERRRRWAARHAEGRGRANQRGVEGGEESQAHILDLEASRQRLPELWASTVGESRTSFHRTPRRRPARPPGQQQQLDPPFPDHPAATVEGYEAASGSVRKYGPAHEGDLYSHPRLARLMDEQDEEERMEKEREKEARRGEQPVEEDDDGEEQDDDEEIEEELVEVFKRAVVERFIKGDPTLPASLYASVDFKDLADEQRLPTSSSAAGQSDSMMRPSRQQELLDEERYFDDDDDDEDEGSSARAGGNATNAEIDY